MTNDEAIQLLGNIAAYDIDNQRGEKKFEALWLAIKALERELIVEWIPVSERPPEEPGTYFTTVDYGEHGLLLGQRYYHGKGFGWDDSHVIAWMPLIEPYKQESEDEG